MELDQSIVNLAKAIRQVESGNRAVTPAEGGQLGGASRYQYTHETWQGVAAKYLNDPNAPLSLENENKATYLRLADWKKQGYDVGQIASMWNAGEGRPNAHKENWKGVNKYGVAYDTPAYAKKIAMEYQKQKQLNPPKVTDASLTTLGQSENKQGILQGLATGMTKGVLSTTKGAAGLGERILGSTLKTLLPKSVEKAIGVDKAPTLGIFKKNEAPTAAQELQSNIEARAGLEQGSLTTPKTTAEKVGFFGEQLAEFFIPGSASWKAAEKIVTTTKGTKAINSLIKLGLKEQSAQKLVKLGTVGVSEGVLGTGQSALQSGKLGKEEAEIGLYSLAAPAVLSAAGKTIKKLAKFTPDNAQSKLATNINDIFSKSPQTVKRIVNFADSQGINIGEEIVKRDIMPFVDNERLKFGTEVFGLLEKEISTNSKIIDDVIAQYPATEIKATDIAKQVIKQISENTALVNEGAVVDVTKKALAKLDDFVAQTGKDRFNLQEIQNFKKGMWQASKKFKPTEIGKSDAYSELGRTFMDVVEKQIPDARIRNINKEIANAMKLDEVLTKVNNLQDAGIVLKGGKLGGFFSGIGGNIAGAAVGGAVGGLPGAAVGVFLGKAFATAMRNVGHRRALLGAMDRILIKFAKKSGPSKEITEAKQFIEKAKAGEIIPVSPVTEKIIRDIYFSVDDKVKLLGPGKPGTNPGKKN